MISGVSATDRDFMPALRFGSLTGLFDPVVAVYAREREFKRRVLRYAALQPGERVLDLGCGTGTLALMARETQPGIEIEGLDADPKVLRSARSKTRDAAASIDFHQGMSTDLPFENARFDVVLSTLFFHHLRDADKRTTAQEVARVLKPGGRLVVGDVGKPQDPAMRLMAAATVQLLDGRTTTQLNIDGGLPEILRGAGLDGVAVTDRLRTPVGTLEVYTGRKDG